MSVACVLISHLLVEIELLRQPALRGKTVLIVEQSGTRKTVIDRSPSAAGMITMVALIYSYSPVHTDEYYAQKAREITQAGAERIFIKDVDVGGTVPYRHRRGHQVHSGPLRGTTWAICPRGPRSRRYCSH